MSTMWSAKKKYNLYREAIGRYGEPRQIIKTVEELSELAQVLCKLMADATPEDEANVEALKDHLAEEMADVQIMLDQLLIIFRNVKRFEWQMVRKLDRLAERLEAEKR